MKLSELKEVLPSLNEVVFQLPDGELVPAHFHVTEVGLVQKRFIDCGGTLRFEERINFQLWEANDFEHRLAPQKLASIVQLSEEKLLLPNAEIEVEYQQGTIGKFNLNFNSGIFHLTNMQTACLAEDKCGIPSHKLKVNLANLPAESTNCCPPGSGCC